MTAGEGEPDRRAVAREAFSLLGHDIRMDILLALLDDWFAVYTEPVGYAELMDAVGMEDSGKFNYHLEKLRGVYVRKTDEGYAPTASAMALYVAVLANRPTDTVEFGPVSVDSACPRCGDAPVLRYEDGFVVVECESCPDWAGFTYTFPQHGFEQRTPDEVLRAAHDQARYDAGLARTGQCPSCAGTTSAELVIEEDTHDVELTCDSCTFVVGVRLLFALLTQPDVIAALLELDVDPAGYVWELPGAEIRGGGEHDRVELVVAADDGRATVCLDGELDVRSVRVQREG